MNSKLRWERDLASWIHPSSTREKSFLGWRGLSAGVVMPVLMLLVSACSHMQKPSDTNAPPISGLATQSPDTPPPGDLTDSGADLKAVPLSINRQVLQWIDYFQGQGRPHMERYLSRSTRYMPVMKQILHKEGLPEDLIYIALIESGFSGAAHSSANAVGYWQFIRGTGRRYGLKVDSYVDERRDYVRSTEAAAHYFKDLYGIFHSWYLAIASYNVGEGRVVKVTNKYKTRDFWQLARENKLPEETTNYVPKFIAARLIAKEPEKYGFTDLEYMAPVDFAEVEFPSSVDLRKLAKGLNIEYDDLRDLNPSYKRGVAFAKNGKLVLRVPKGMEAQALAASGTAVAESKTAYVSDEDYGYYKVRRGDTIKTIAKKFGTSQRNIRMLNRLKRGASLVAGRRLRVPAETVGGLARQDVDGVSSKPKKADPGDGAANTKPTTLPAAPGAASSSAPTMSAGPAIGIDEARKFMVASKQATREVRAAQAHFVRQARHVHIVRKGDTLAGIARRYRISVRRLAIFNNLGRRAKVMVGTRLEIP